MTAHFDVVIVGGGPTGEHAAGQAHGRGLSAAVVEAELVGGECSYWACIPSKTLLRPGHALADVRLLPGAREAVTGSIDVAASLARRDWMTSSWSDDGQVEWLNGVGASLFRGHGRLAGERRVLVDAGDGSVTELEATKAVVLAVGSSAAVPPIPGLAESRYWTNREATSSETIPKRLLVLGGGASGVELAQAYRRLGAAEVTILEAGNRLVANVEPFASELLAASFERDGIVVRTTSKVVVVRRSGSDGEIVVTLDGGEEIAGDELLVSVGRHPRTLDLGLDTVGLEAGRYIETNASLNPTAVDTPWLYVIGDANGRALLTHMGKYQARIALGRIAGEEVHDEADSGAITAVIFTDPEIGSVGLTEKQARASGRDVRTVAVDLSSIAAAAIWGEHCVGRCQLVVDSASEVPIGATFVGPTMGDALHAATIAVVGKVPMRELRHAVPSFPSMSEVWLELIEAYFRS